MKTTSTLTLYILLSAAALKGQTSGAMTGTRTTSDPEPLQVNQLSVGPPTIDDSISKSPPVSNHGNDHTYLPDTQNPKKENAEANRRDYRNWRTGDWRDRVGEPDLSWGKAMRHPYMWTTSASLVGLTVTQLVKTDRCLSENRFSCNLFFGRNRGAAYAVNIPVAGGIIFLVGKMKERGHGGGAMKVLAVSLIGEAILAATANPGVLTCRAGRIPQCQ